MRYQTGELKYEWQDFEFKGLSGIIKMNKDKFEKNYGKFVAMNFKKGNIKPYAIWSESKVVLFLDSDPLGIASVSRNPDEGMFG